MGLALKTVEHAQISLQLSQIRRFELSLLELHRHEAVQLPVEEQQVNILILTKSIQVILIPHKGEVFSKCQNEVLDIVDDGVFYHLLVYILPITDIQLFHVDVIK